MRTDVFRKLQIVSLTIILFTCMQSVQATRVVVELNTFEVDTVTMLLVSTTTHPEQSLWYQNNDPVFTWTPFITATAYYAIFDQQAETVPTPETADLLLDTSIDYPDTADGTWYFHITPETELADSVVIHLPIKIDRSAPSISSSTHTAQDGWYSSSEVEFSWTIEHPESAKSYRVLIDDEPSSVPSATAQEKSETTMTLSEQADGVHYLHVVWEDQAGNIGAAGHYRFQIDTTLPEPVTDLIAARVGGDIVLRWTADVDNGYYQIYRSLRQGVPGQKVVADGNVTGDQYTDVGKADDSVDYFYMVFPVDRAGNIQREGNYQANYDSGTPSQGSLIGEFKLELLTGLNIISLPVQPETPITAKTLAEQLSATIILRYDRETAKFVPYVPNVLESTNFELEGGVGYIVNVLKDQMITLTGTVWDNVNEAPRHSEPKVKNLWAFAFVGDLDSTIYDTAQIVAINRRTGVEMVGVIVGGRFAIAVVDQSRNSVIEVGDDIEIRAFSREGRMIGENVIQIENHDIVRAFAQVDLRLRRIPAQTRLLQNYPNPFNPETWIPFELAEPASVVISIYDISGKLVRKIGLGERLAGVYVSKNKAVYWDGRTDQGEKVSTGLYFYTLRAGKCMHNLPPQVSNLCYNFCRRGVHSRADRHRGVQSAVKRMLILK